MDPGTEGDLSLDLDLDLESRIFSPSIFRAPHLMAMGGTPPLSPLELPASLDSGSCLFGLFPTSIGMRAYAGHVELWHVGNDF